MKIGETQYTWNRRDFLKTLALTGGAFYSEQVILAGDPSRWPASFATDHARRWPVFRLVRARDLLFLHLELINLRVVAPSDPSKPLRLHILSHGQPGYLVLHFPGQHIAEQAIWDRGNIGDSQPLTGDPPPPQTYELRGLQSKEKNQLKESGWVFNNENDLEFLMRFRGGQKGQPKGLAGAWLSGPSQLVFEVPQWLLPVSFDVDTILDLCVTKLNMVVSPIVASVEWPENDHNSTESAAPPFVSPGHQPGANPPVTAIEFPSLLYLSPYQTARWKQRPLTGMRLCEQWGFDLETPQASAELGAPRAVQARGHLFAFANRHIAQANWPLPAEIKKQPRPAKADSSKDKPNQKYSSTEVPKTSLYEATRSLLVRQHKENNGDITASRLRLSASGATARLQYKVLFEPEAPPSLNTTESPDTPALRLGRLRDFLSQINKAPDFFKTTKLEEILKVFQDTLDREPSAVRQELVGKFKILELEVSPDEWALFEEALPRALRVPGANTVSKPEGLLLEWIQKTETGRDFYTKESFSGFWMPFGFKAEVVTITERLPCSDRVLKPGPDDDYVELRDQEGNLTAFLVARKFARVRPWRNGTRKREFPSPESADFLSQLGVAGRTAGLRAVEILVERTPVLANKGIDARPRLLDALKAGEDILVDNGSGLNAAKEIFWPRVEDFTVNDNGENERSLAVFKFPIRLTYLDGAEEIVQLPMFFVPSENEGRSYYPETPPELRTAGVSIPVAAAEPPPPATLSATDFGSLAAGELAKFLPENDKELANFLTFPPDNPASPPNAKPPLNSAGLELLTGSLNVFLDNLPAELARRTSMVRDKIEAAWSEVETWGEYEKQFRAKIQALTDLQLKALKDSNLESPSKIQILSESADQAVRTLERAVAWGITEIGQIDSNAAAERVVQLFRTASNKEALSALWQKRSKAILAFIGSLELLKKKADAVGEPVKAAALAAVHTRITSLKDTLEQIASLPSDGTNAQAKCEQYFRTLNDLSIQWAVQLGTDWRRETWDPIFCALAYGLKPSDAISIATAAFQKEISYAVLGGLPKIEIGDIKLDFSTLIQTGKDFLPPVVKPEICGEIEKILEALTALIASDVAAAKRLLDAVNKALPEERILRQRLHWFIEDQLAGSNLSAALQVLTSDLGKQLAFVLTHYQDGESRLRRFLMEAAGAPEIAAVLQAELNRKVENFKRKLGEDVKGTLPAVEKIADALEKFCAEANLDRVKAQVESMAFLSGGKTLDEIRTSLHAAREGALQYLQNLIHEVPADIRLDSPNLEECAKAVRESFQRVSELARGVIGKHHAMLDRLLTPTQQTFNVLGNFAKGSPPEVVGWLTRVKLQFHPTDPALSPRLLFLVEDLTLAILKSLPAVDPNLKKFADFRKEIQLKIVKAAGTGEILAAHQLRGLVADLKKSADSVDRTFRQRIEALEKLAEDSRDAFNRLEDVVFGLAGVPAEILEIELPKLLAALSSSALQTELKKKWSQAEAHLNELRGYVGDATDFAKALERLPAGIHSEANAAREALRSQLQSIGGDLHSHLTKKAENLQDEALSFLKRASVSLPSATLLNSFADQTAKAVFSARNIVFTAMQEKADALRDLVAFPKIESLNVKLPGVGKFEDIVQAEAYLQKGLRDFDAAAGKVFADLKNQVESTGQAAGIGAASTRIKALSREAGALSYEAVRSMQKYQEITSQAATELYQGTVGENLDAVKTKLKQEAAVLRANASDILGAAAPKLFNQIDLAKVLGTLGNPGDIPKAISREFPDRVERVMSLRKMLDPKDSRAIPGLLSFEPRPGTEFTLDSRVTAWLPRPGAPNRGVSTEVRGQIGPFCLVIGSMLGLSFRSLTFVNSNGVSKCNPKFGKEDGGDITDAIELRGPLAFLQDIVRNFSSFLSGQIPFTATFDGERIYAGVNVAIPALSFGAFALSNLSFRFSVGLPVARNSPLVARFAIADRVETFKLSVCGFTGGGFFAMKLSSDPMLGEIEAALEFGGRLGLNFFVASGELSVMAGIYYRKKAAEVDLSAYLRACGSLHVLFIDVCVIFYLALRYRTQDGALAGEASVTVRVSIGFFSKTFCLRFEKTIAGSNKTAFHMPAPETLVAANRPEAPLFAMLTETGVSDVSPMLSSGHSDPPSSGVSLNAPHLIPSRFTQQVNKDRWNKYWKQFAAS